MRERSKLATMIRLVGLQRASRTAAEAALAGARAAETAASRQEQVSRQRSAAARMRWSRYLTEPGFWPEHARALSADLIGCEQLADEAELGARFAAEATRQRHQDWQRLEARLRSTEGLLQRLHRKQRKKAEEKRLAEIADQFGLRRGRRS